MIKLISGKYCLILFLLLLCVGCARSGVSVPDNSIPPIESKKIIIIGFRPAVSTGQKAAIFNNPLSGAMVKSNPVSGAAADKLSEKMHDYMFDTKDYEFINPREIKNSRGEMVFEINNNDAIKNIQAIGKAFSAEVAIAGYIYRMDEREGTEYSVERPASAAFVIYLVGINDGSILWKGNYSKTQSSLSENLLDFKSYMQFKGKWVTVNELVQIGLIKLLDEMPLKNKSLKR